MADRVVEDQNKEQNDSRVSWGKGCSNITKKGLADKNSHALFVNFNNWERMSEREKKKRFGDMDIIMTGFAGLKGSVALAYEKYELLLERYPASFLDKAKKQERFLWQVPEAAPARKSDDCSAYSFSVEGITGMYLLSEGGVFAGLWNMGKQAGVGLKIYCKDIPIKQETIEICNFFDVNPYQMFSEGSCLLLANNGCRLRKMLMEQGIFSEIIGFTTENNDRVVINGDECRYLQKSYADALETARCRLNPGNEH